MTSFLVVKKNSFKPDSFEEINCVFNFFFHSLRLSCMHKALCFLQPRPVLVDVVSAQVTEACQAWGCHPSSSRTREKLKSYWDNEGSQWTEQWWGVQFRYWVGHSSFHLCGLCGLGLIGISHLRMVGGPSHEAENQWRHYGLCALVSWVKCMEITEYLLNKYMNS